MNRLLISWGFGLLTILGLASFGIPQQPAPLPMNQAITDDGVDVQLRGPLHEAFAQPLDMNPEPGAVIPKAPPPAIPEEPPTERPDAANAQWIPGYWAWDAERQDYLWVSGVYRVPPQGRTFIPGYWEQSPDGWRWISGFWSNDNQQQITYTPQPPAPLDNGPSMPAPDDNSMYVPGTWIYRDGRFVWRPGYYAAVQDGRVWVPSRYQWTPRGYAFVDSYWDVPFEDRGLIFAPVCFDQPYWTNPGWRYRPSYLVDFGLFFNSAFLRNGGGHYYYGNYHDGRYAQHGYRPWFTGAGRYDPVFAYHGWQNRGNQPNWAANQQQVYANRTSGRAAAPPVTLAQQRAIVNAKTGTQVVTPVQQFKNDRVRLVTATPTQQKAQQVQVQQTRVIVQNRQKLEAVAVNNTNVKSPGAMASTTVNRSNLLGTNATVVAPNVQIPGKVAQPRVVPTPSPTAPTTKSLPTPRSVTPLPAVPKAAPPQQKAVAPATKQAPPAPKVVTPPATKALAPAAKQAAPAPAMKTATPLQKAAPPAAMKASVPAAPSKVATRPAAPPRPNAAPSSPQRAQPAPRVQPPPRVSAPPQRSNPAPVRSNPPPRPAPNSKKR